jgi:uroporphyrinogen-III synthase
MSADALNPLRGIRVLVTRPSHQAQGLCDKITNLGGSTIRLPAIEIAAPRDIAPALELIEQLEKFDIAVFISSNAAERAHALVSEHGGWPHKLKIAAVGKHTAATLRDLGIHVDIRPQLQFNSEALLAAKEMQDVATKAIIIFRGEGGRELLAQTLRQRGARVVYAEVYRRVRPAAIDIDEVQRAGITGNIHIITVTSSEGLQNMFDILGRENRSWLLDVPLLVFSQRTAALGQKLGFKTTITTSQASDQGLVDALKEWYASNTP